MSLDVYLTKKVDVGGADPEEVEFFWANITHNLGKMAEMAGIYMVCWRPEEVGITKAKQLIEPLTRGILTMWAEPNRFRDLEATNGWGTYDNFMPWLEKYLEACKRYPLADVSVSR